jgi:hypothetical protein
LGISYFGFFKKKQSSGKVTSDNGLILAVVIEFFANSPYEKKFKTGGIAAAFTSGASLELNKLKLN